MPGRAHLMVTDSEEIHAGDVLAKIPRAATKTKDITGGSVTSDDGTETREYMLPRNVHIGANDNDSCVSIPSTSGRSSLSDR